MKQIIFTILFTAVSVIAVANTKVPIGKSVMNVYNLHNYPEEEMPIPTLFVYDTQNESFLSPNDVLNFVVLDADVRDPIKNKILKISKDATGSRVSKNDLSVASSQIQFNNRYLVFFNNMGDEFLSAFPDHPEARETEETIIQLLESRENVNLYTIF